MNRALRVAAAVAVAALVTGGAQAAVERRAVWIRPPETPAALEATVTAAAAAGFTDVFLEAFYHARTVYPSDVAPQRTSFDALDTARARAGCQVHAWVEVLYWSPAPAYLTQSPLWLEHQDWSTLDRSGRSSKANTGMGFVDPGIPDVRQTVIALAAELGARYPDVGLHLDYLRYPRDTSYGYAPVATARYHDETGLDANAAGFAGRDPDAWTRWRSAQVTSLAAEMIAAYHAAGGRSLVSAAVQPLPPRLGGDPLQDWEAWPGLEVAIPMMYAPNTVLLNLGALALAAPTPAGTPTRWLGVRVGSGAPTLESELSVAERLGFPGMAVFGWEAPAAPAATAPSAVPAQAPR